MNVVHRITGYDKRTEELAYEFDVALGDLDELRRMANVSPQDPGALGSYPLDRTTTSVVAQKLNLPLRLDACDWFLEPFAV